MPASLLATCLRCGHHGTITAAELRSLRHEERVMTLDYLSRVVRCEACRSRAVELQRLSEAQARAFIAA